MGGSKFNGGGKLCDGLASHPGESRNSINLFRLQKLELDADLMDHLACRKSNKLL